MILSAPFLPRDFILQHHPEGGVTIRERMTNKIARSFPQVETPMHTLLGWCREQDLVLDVIAFQHDTGTWLFTVHPCHSVSSGASVSEGG